MSPLQTDTEEILLVLQDIIYSRATWYRGPIQLHPGEGGALTPGKRLKILLSCPEL